MPIFEYECEKCGYNWDELFLGKAKNKLICPKCESKSVVKKLSRFSFGSGCGSCVKNCSQCHK